jgi:hypothetical protein
MKLPWRHTAEAKSLLRLAKSMDKFRQPVSSISTQCTKLVLAINHAIEKFELSSKDKFAFLKCSQVIDTKLVEIASLRIRIDVVGGEGTSIQDRIFLIDVPISDVEGIELKREVIEGCQLLASTLDQYYDKLDSVEKQLEEIREELRAEVR